MKANREVIDADGHITETDDQLRPYMDSPHHDRKAVFYPRDNWDRSLGGTLGTRARDAKSWLNAMDEGGLSIAVLFPTDGIGFGWIREPDFAVVLAKAYNNFFAEEFTKVSPRLKGVALIPFQDVQEGVKELRRAVKELGMVAGMLPAVGLRLPLGHPDYWPIYEEAEKLNCPLAVHATVRGPHYFAADLFDQFIDVHTLSHPFAQMIQMTSLILRGVMERFPRLRLAFMEAGCSWVPYWMARMDEEWEKRGTVEAPLCKKRPSEYVLSGRVFLHAEGYEPFLPQTVQLLGPQVLFYASDWPHWDHEYPENIEHLGRREDLNAEVKSWIFCRTAKAMYGL